MKNHLDPSYFYAHLRIPVAVAFFLSVKQQVLGYTQLQKGPNTMGPYGLLQPGADCLKDIKLFIKFHPSSSSWCLLYKNNQRGLASQICFPKFKQTTYGQPFSGMTCNKDGKPNEFGRAG